MPEWNRAQLDAIEARGGSVFVSAAAGSGKTAVLVERVIRKIVSGEIDADRFLIVTFTKAAAAELRRRISEAIENRINSSSSDEELKHLIRQRNLLPLAKISTIDSFTQSLVRENSQYLGLPSKFELLEDNEIALYSKEVLSETLEVIYDTELENENSPLLELMELICDDKNDDKLSDAIIKLHENADAYPFFDEYIDGIADALDPGTPLEENVYLKFYFQQLQGMLSRCKTICKTALEMLAGVDGLAENRTLFENLLDQFETIEKCCKTGDFDNALESLRTFDWGELQRKGVTKDLSVVSKECTSKRNACKGLFKSSVLIYSKDEIISDFEYLYPIVKALAEATKSFHKKYLEFKKEHSRFTFNDILHYAVSLVAECGEKRGEYRPTELALSLRDSFDEILIDEYQDTNAAQDLLFSMISKDNLFCVGDVKQSIYRFRKAQPSIFIDKINSSAYYDRENPVFPAKIILDSNYRSRKCITEATNFIFGQIMSRDAGDVDYGDDEKLNPGFEYLEAKEAVELHLIDSKSDDDSDDDETAIQYYAGYIAKLIKSLLDSGFKVEDKDSKSFRQCRPSDFMVLSRSVKEIGPALVAELGKKSVGGFVEAEGEFFGSYEIALMLNLMRVIDNPQQDIPLLSVMMSPVFGFSADEMAKLRIDGEDRRSDIYSLLCAQREKNSKIDSFLSKISSFRSLAYTMSTPVFIRELYDETQIEYLALLMNSPEKKRGNLSLLLHYADTYQAVGHIGLSGFIRYIDKLQESRLELEGSLDKAFGGDSVRIMTIHKSKGLQAPIVILFDKSEKYILKDTTKELNVSPALGVGLKRKNKNDDGIEFITSTLAHDVVKIAETRALKSEEMRKYYVALTRAEERLLIVRPVKGLSEEGKLPFEKLAAALPETAEKYDPLDVLSLSVPFNTIILPLLRHPDAGPLRSLAGIEAYPPFESDGFRLDIHVNEFSESSEAEEENALQAEADDALLKIIDDAVSYSYKYLPLTHLVSKQAASEVDDLSVDNPYFAVSKPAFLMSGGFSATQKGTITHSFMQYVNFDAISFDGREVFGVEEEIESLKRRAIISEDEAAVINVKAVKAFFASSLAERMRKSPCLMREKKFTVHLPIDYFDKSLSRFEGEKLTIQGIADAVFEEDGALVIVDYKTDRVENEDELIDRYWSQIKTYKEAMLQCTPYKKVASMILYSFYLERAIEVKD